MVLEWNSIKVGNEDFFNRYSGDTPAKRESSYWDGDIKWLSNSEVSEDRVNLISDTKEKITKEGLDNCTAGIIPENSVILSCTASIGKVAINKDQMATNQQFNAFEIKQGFNPFFLANQFYFRSGELQAMGGSTTHNHLAVYVLEKFDIEKPPLNEQRRIASVLYNVDQAIKKTEKIIEQTRRVKKGLMQDLFTEGYYEHEEFKEVRIGPMKRKIPCSWELVSLDDAVNNRDSERVPVKSKKRENMQGNIPYYGASGVIDYVDDYLFDEKLILLAEDGANLVTRTKPISFIIKGKTWVNNHAHVLEPNPDFSIDYLMHYLRSLNYKPFVTRTAQPKLNQKMLNMIEVPKPHEKEQKKIAEILRENENKVDKLKEQRKCLQRLKKGLMQDLLTGKVRTKDKDIEILDEVLEVEKS